MIVFRYIILRMKMFQTKFVHKFINTHTFCVR